MSPCMRDAGFLASAVFLAGIAAHHVRLYWITDLIPPLSLRRRERPDPEHGWGRQHRQERHAGQSEQTRRRQQEQAQSDKAKATKESTQPKRQKPDTRSSAAQEEIRREQERLKREKERLDAERREFAREQQEHRSPPDTRTDEQILGLSGDYTLADLKKARNVEVKRWNTSNMVNKPEHLVQQAEEEMKKINLAYERLKKKLESA